MAKADGAKGYGGEGLAALSYVAASILSATVYSWVSLGKIDVELISVVGAGVALVGLIPFIVIKILMAKYAWQGAVAHVVSGAIVGISGLLLLGRSEMLYTKAAFALAVWGGMTGLLYWALLRLGQRLILGRRG